MAPKYFKTDRAFKEFDVYSFGIVTLEIACGRKTFNPMAPKDQEVMLDWVRELHGRQELLKAVDKRLCGHFD